MKARNVAYILVGVTLFFFTAWLISCAVNPVTGKHELMLLTENDEISLGKETDQQIIETYGIYDDPELTAYLDKLGQEMAVKTHRPNLPYTFKVLDTPVVNAFAVPGGYVYFTRGILGYLNNEAEFAGVLGHELGHVNARHSAVQYSRAQLAQLGLGVGMIFSEKFRDYAGLAQFGVGMLFLKYSRDNERQADDLGVEYSSKSGYNSMAMADFFNTLERMHPSSDGSGLPEWFSTHPNPVNRVEAVRNKTKEWQSQLAGKDFVYNRDNYLAQVDGITFGEDPRQGYVEGNAFYHPELQITFPVPSEWALNNTPEQVQMVSPQENAAIMFTLDNSSTPLAASQSFTQNAGATITASDAITVNSYKTQRVFSTVTSEESELKVVSYFIQKDNKIYVFHGFTDTASFNGYQNSFTGTMGQFKKLTDPAKLNVKPKTLHVKTVSTPSSLRAELKKNGIADDKLEEFAILNGMELDASLKAGSKIKVVGN